MDVTELPEPLFSITLHRDGTVQVQGGPPTAKKMAEVLHIIADSIADGSLQLNLINSGETS